MNQDPTIAHVLEPQNEAATEHQHQHLDEPEAEPRRQGRNEAGTVNEQEEIIKKFLRTSLKLIYISFITIIIVCTFIYCCIFLFCDRLTLLKFKMVVSRFPQDRLRLVVRIVYHLAVYLYIIRARYIYRWVRLHVF